MEFKENIVFCWGIIKIFLPEVYKLGLLYVMYYFAGFELSLLIMLLLLVEKKGIVINNGVRK